MTAQVKEIDVAALGPLVRIAGGGQGLVYRPRDDPDGPVYKEYLPRVVDDLDVDALRAFVRFAEELDEPDQAALLSRVAWPQVVVRRDGVVRGFLMRQVPAEYRAELRFAGVASQELATAQFLLNPPGYLERIGLRITDRFRVEFLADTADALAVLHRLDISVGDLSPNNLLFSHTSRPRCFFVDSDSMRLGPHSVLPQGETPDWRVGDLGDEELATGASDVYKFGLLTARLFAGDQHTTDTAEIPVRLRRHVVRCLAADPRQRPAAEDLVTPLNRVLARLPETPPVEEPTPEPVPEQRAAPEEHSVPAQPQPRPATPAKRRRLFWYFVPIPLPILLGVVLGLLDGSGGSGGSGALPTYSMPLVPPPTEWGLPGYSVPQLDPVPDLIPSYPNLVPSYDLTPLLCLTGTGAEVVGGAGLTAARVAVDDLCSTAAVSRWTPLRERAPYLSVQVVGFFGEGTPAPTATVDFTDYEDRCWRTSVGFDAGYVVRSVGPMSPCG